MKHETKLWLRKRTLMALRAVIWHADEWLHRQEVAFREDIDGIQKSATARQHVGAPERTFELAKGSQGQTWRAPQRTFQQSGAHARDCIRVRCEVRATMYVYYEPVFWRESKTEPAK